MNLRQVIVPGLLQGVNSEGEGRESAVMEFRVLTREESSAVVGTELERENWPLSVLVVLYYGEAGGEDDELDDVWRDALDGLDFGEPE